MFTIFGPIDFYFHNPSEIMFRIIHNHVILVNFLNVTELIVIMKNEIRKFYSRLKNSYGPQGWWPIINNETLICEYGVGAPRNESEVFEICIGCILAQNTQWYPNVVRAIQQLKLGRPFTKEELEVIEQAEIHRGIMREKPRKITTGHKITQNSSWSNVEKALKNLRKYKLIDPERISKISSKRLSSLIRPAGYYNQKTIKLKVFSEFYLSLNGKIPLRETLLDIWGIGPETADSILLYAYHVPTFVVDTYTRRIFSRMNMIEPDAKYDEIKSLFEKNLPKDYELYQEYHALIVEDAKRMRSERK